MALQTVMEYTFHMNSQQRNTGTNTNCNFDMAQIINLLSKKGMFQIIFNSVQIPFTFYQMNNLDNLNRIYCTFQRGNLGDLPISTFITLTPGNYQPTTLMAELAIQLTAKAITLGWNPALTFTYSYNAVTGFMTFNMTYATTLGANAYIYLNFNNPSQNPYTPGFFGYTTSYVFQILPTLTLPNPSVSLQPCVLNPINYLLVRSTFKQFRNREFVVLKDDVSDIVYKVPILTPQSSWINYFQMSEPVYIIDNAIQSMNFYLTNNLSYTPISLQNIPWSFSFTIREVIRPEWDSFTPLVNTLPPKEQIDIDGLQQQKEEELRRLEMYKQKLLKRDTKNKDMDIKKENITDV
jgi:hypothetical protein